MVQQAKGSYRLALQIQNCSHCLAYLVRPCTYQPGFLYLGTFHSHNEVLTCCRMLVGMRKLRG